MNITYPVSKKSQKSHGILPFLAALVLFGGVAIGAAIATSGGDSAGAPVSIDVPVLPEFTRSNSIMVLYIVESEEQEQMVWAGEQMAASERASANILEPDQHITVMRVTTPEQERDANDIVFNWDGAGLQYRVIDYRGR